MVSGSNAGFAGTAQHRLKVRNDEVGHGVQMLLIRGIPSKSAVRAAVWNSADAPCWCTFRRRWSWSPIYSLVAFIPLNLLHRRRTEPCQVLIFLAGGTGSCYEFLKVLYIVSFPPVFYFWQLITVIYPWKGSQATDSLSVLLDYVSVNTCSTFFI